MVRQALDAVTAGACKRLMLFLPPRHGKSTLATIHYPAWRLEQDPALRVVIGCYNQTLADKFSRRVRSLVRGRGVVAMDPERQAVHDWLTAAGGGLRAVGIGSGITGQGADLLILDDPVKSREEANSDVYRDRCYDWFTDDIYTRLEPGAAVVLIMTRWHEDDLAGRILASESAADWTVITLPALAEADDPLGRPLGAALCPARYDEKALADLATVLGPSGFSALYAQRPQPAGGLLFRREWFALLPAVPVDVVCVRYWDKAGTLGGGSFTAGVKMARTTAGRYIIEDVIRAQVEAPEREELIYQTAVLDGPAVRVFVEQEPGSGGKDSALGTVRNLAGFIVEADRVTGDKALRAEPLAAQAKVGNVSLLAAPWTAAWLAEAAAFPSGKRKDQIDAASGAFNKLAIVGQPYRGAVGGTRSAPMPTPAPVRY